MVCSHTFKAADRNRLFFQAATPACGFTRTIADSAEDAREDIAFAIDHVGVREPALSDQSNILGNISVGGTAPLAIHYLMKIIRIVRVRAFHFPCTPATCPAPGAGISRKHNRFNSSSHHAFTVKPQVTAANPQLLRCHLPASKVRVRLKLKSGSAWTYVDSFGCKACGIPWKLKQPI